MGRISARTLLLAVASIAWVTMLSHATCGDDVPASANDDATIGRLLEQVAAHREEIFSAKIVYRWHLATYRRTGNTPQRVRVLLDQYDLIGDPDSLRELVHTLVPEPATSDPPWERRTFYMLGDRRRADTSRDVIQLVDGENEMTYHGFNEQLTVDARGKSSVHLTSITDFRRYPPSGLQAEDYRVAEQSDKEVTLEMVPPSDAEPDFIPPRYTLDRATGVMTHYVQHVRGQLYREAWQLALTQYPGGITMPAVRIATLYRDGRLNTLRVFLVEEAEFNGPVPEDQFVMPVPEDTVLVDLRHEEKDVREIEQPVEDVRSILVPVGSRPGSVPVTIASEKPRQGMRLLLILNGIAFVVLATVLWRKASDSGTRSTSTKR